MKIFFATYSDVVKFNRKPNEDYFLISKKHPIFAVADGVTRGIFEDKRYAYPAGAHAAAEIFCFSVIDHLETNVSSRGDHKLLEKAFDEANERIHELNENEGRIENHDWYANDYFDCVGVAGFLDQNMLHYGYVGDCGLAIFDKDNNLKFETKDQVATSPHHKEIEQVAQGKNWNHAKRLAYGHEHFRNNPSGKYYGTFSGEEAVKIYYQIGSQKIQEGDLVIFYSDGFVGYLESKEFLRIVRQGDKEALDDFTAFKAMTSPVKFGTDRTLITVTF